MHSLYHLAFRYLTPLFRKRRMESFLRTFPINAQTTILDVGGFPGTWINSGTNARITVLNLSPITYNPAAGHPPITTVVGDGCALTQADQSFDIVFSNSVIEHVGAFERQVLFARECLRVGRGVWIQTPARSFFIEPHLMTPFVHWFPRSVQRSLLGNFTVWGLLTRPTRERVLEFLEEVRLCTEEDVERLFPGCKIQREIFLGLTKSYIAVRPWSKGR